MSFEAWLSEKGIDKLDGNDKVRVSRLIEACREAFNEGAEWQSRLNELEDVALVLANGLLSKDYVPSAVILAKEAFNYADALISERDKRNIIKGVTSNDQV